MRKLEQYEIYKLETSRFFEIKGKNMKIIPVTLSYEDAIANGEVVNIQGNQLINVIKNYMKSSSLNLEIKDVIINVVVPTGKKKQGEKEYKELAIKGIKFNGIEYVRILSGSGQIRRNTITFIRKDFYEPIFTTLMCGLELSDFGNAFNAAKFNAYSGLNMSGCHLLPSSLTPTVCVVDDMEMIKPHQKVNHVSEREVYYITLPDRDIILDDISTDEYKIEEKHVIRKSDNVAFTIRKGIHKDIAVEYYDEIPDSPKLNSFDGQGMMSPDWAEKVSSYLSYGFIPSEMIIRAPWVKGLLATVPFKKYFLERGITEIVDSFGTARKVSDIDVIISKSQFKMHKVYKSKCSGTGINAWDYHVDAMKKNHLLWGVVKTNGKKDDDEKALNYQYLQALELKDEDIEQLCQRTREFLETLNCGDIESLYHHIFINGSKFDDEEESDENEEIKRKIELVQKIIDVCPDMIEDSYVRNIILKECESKLNAAKLGKILVRGNFQFCVADPVAQLQWIEKNHCGKDVEVVGFIPAGCIYTNYWLNTEDKTEFITLMRSPLIDRNEISKRKLISEKDDMYEWLKSGIVLSVHDLTALQLGGCDFDGDILFSTNDSIIANGCYDFEMAKPLYYKLDTTDLVGTITKKNLIEADVRGLNSQVGTISNKGGSLYAMLNQYEESSEEYKKIYESIVALGQVVGMEIDRIKTAVKPTMPKEWLRLQAEKNEDDNAEAIEKVSEEERQGIYRHNMLLPVIRPYFFRYLYGYLDDNIKQLERCINEVSVLTFGIKIDKLIDLCESGNANEEMMHLYEQYKSAYPVNNSNCVVNHVCHYFEDFEKTLKRNVSAGTTNKLKSFVPDSELNTDLLKQFQELCYSYNRIKQIITKRYNCKNTDSHKNLRKKCYEMMVSVRKSYREKMMELAQGDNELAFSYLMEATKDYKIVWELLDKKIVNILRGAKND